MATMTVNLAGAKSRSEMVAQRNHELFERQRAAKKPITPEVFFAKHIDNSRIVMADDPERRREMRIFTTVLTVLFLLVMTYVWQHFSSIEMGYKIEAQKRQVEELREENRQVRLNEAQLAEPARIDRIAKQLGLDQPAPGQVIRTDGVTGQEGAPVMAAVVSTGGGME